jgi:hypothetical protein
MAATAKQVAAWILRADDAAQGEAAWREEQEKAVELVAGSLIKPSDFDLSRQDQRPERERSPDQCGALL